MTYAVSAALQTAVYGRLSADAAIAALIGSNVYDVTPAGVLPQTYIVIGQEDVRDKSDVSAKGAQHDLTISVLSDAAGFSAAKATAAAICDTLIDADLTLTRGSLVGISFLRAQARRGKAPDGRRIDLIFRARVDDI